MVNKMIKYIGRHDIVQKITNNDTTQEPGCTYSSNCYDVISYKRRKCDNHKLLDRSLTMLSAGMSGLSIANVMQFNAMQNNTK